MENEFLCVSASDGTAAHITGRVKYYIHQPLILKSVISAKIVFLITASAEWA
jgi:hypothetical protein